MKLNVDTILPILIIGAIAFTMYYNNKTPSTSPSGNTIIKPKVSYNTFRGTDDAKDHDNTVTFKHTASGDKFSLLMWHNYLLLPDGQKSLPTKDDGTGKQIPIWSIEHERKEYLFDTGWDIGAYTGYLTGKTEGKVSNFDAGIKFSPVRVWNSFSPDILASGQGVGLGISFYPRPEIYGEVWDHLGVGYGRFYTLRDDNQRNLFYLTISTRF